MINFSSFFFVLGGYCDGTSSSRIAKFETNTWTEVGNLKQARFGHRSIATNDRVYIVGGYNAYLYVFISNLPLSSKVKHKFSDTEILKFSENKIEIESTEPILSYYAYYPELFAIDPGFCV